GEAAQVTALPLDLREGASLRHEGCEGLRPHVRPEGRGKPRRDIGEHPEAQRADHAELARDLRRGRGKEVRLGQCAVHSPSFRWPPGFRGAGGNTVVPDLGTVMPASLVYKGESLVN